MRRIRLAVLGGTFDHLHVGHHALLATAFRVGREVGIGLTTDRFVADHPKPLPGRIQSFSVRRGALTRWIRRNFPRRTWWIVPIETPFGRSVEPGVDALVVSPETLAGGRAVNRERRRLGRAPLELVRVPLALADDLDPVSSRRVRSGAIRADGRRSSLIRVCIVVDDPRDRPSVERAVRRVFPRVRILGGPASNRNTGPGVDSVGRRPIPRGGSEPDLEVRISRRGAAGWVATERSPRVRLRPRGIRGARSADLERGLVVLLRPRQ